MADVGNSSAPDRKRRKLYGGEPFPAEYNERTLAGFVRGYYQRIADMLDLDRMGERLPGPPPIRFLARHGTQIRRALAGSIALLAVAACLGFAGDYALLRYRMAAGSQPFGMVTVRPYYAVRLKSGKTEFLFQNPRPESCVDSLLPHLGMSPCWYLRRHPEKRTDIDPE